MYKTRCHGRYVIVVIVIVIVIVIIVVFGSSHVAVRDCLCFFPQWCRVLVAKPGGTGRMTAFCSACNFSSACSKGEPANHNLCRPCWVSAGRPWLKPDDSLTKKHPFGPKKAEPKSMTRQIQYPWPSQKRVRVSDLDVSFFDSLAYHKIPVPEQHDWTDLDLSLIHI